jgi:DNA-binding FrmR family transcriptional regulator
MLLGGPIRAPLLEGQKMSVLVDEQSRNELLNRLKRAEGQLRGIQRMIESGQPGIDVASQLVAVRRALDSTYVHMTVSLVEQELGNRLGDDARRRKQIAEVLGELTALLAKVR